MGLGPAPSAGLKTSAGSWGCSWNVARTAARSGSDVESRAGSVSRGVGSGPLLERCPDPAGAGSRSGAVARFGAANWDWDRV